MVSELIREFSKDFVRRVKEPIKEENLIVDELLQDIDLEDMCPECLEEVKKMAKEVGEEICEDCEEEDSDIETIEEEVTDLLNEISASTVKVSKRTKMHMLTGLSSVRIAKKKNDPVYKKYHKYRNMALMLKRKLMKKYKSRGRKAARRSARRR